MSRRKHQPLGPISNILTVTLLYIILIILVLVLARQILTDISAGEQLRNIYIVPLGIVLPVFLFGSVGLQLIKLIKDRRENRPGTRFKTKLMIFFFSISLLASLPQAVLSLAFIDTALHSWYSAELGEALDGGVDIALAYNSERVENLVNLSESTLFYRLLDTTDYNGLWETLRETNSAVDSLQVFQENSSVSFSGDPVLILDEPPETIAENGIVPKEYLGPVTVQRVARNYRLGNGGIVTIVFSSRFPDDFGSSAEKLTQSRQTYRQIQEYKNIFRLVLLIFFSYFSLPVFLLAILVSFLLSDELIRPIVSLEEATRRAAEGDFSYRILGRSRDELSILTASFNRMMSELENSRRTTLQTEKVTAWQEIAQRLAHEIRNPLTPIKLSAQRILRRYEKDPDHIGDILEGAVSSIIREVENLDLLLQEFRDFARLPRSSRYPIRLADLLEDISSQYRSGYPGIAFDFSGADRDIELPLDREQISRVFTNLFKNAVEAMGSEGTIIARTDLVRKGNTRYCRVQVEDSGCGIAAENQGEVFNPYFTTKSHGTGLGLPIVERIVFDHHGQIWFESAVGVGTTFFIDLPLEL
ncbi:ATP-binding protein [Marispirochaeta sp.]|uniref:sensor histidine kinase n=1 Tax=Marispirochaeta sp. TaxID=2038653 RepID=UPI0029C68015|nr:ATP-binding protein [Marispirochaeta sp.]